MKVLSEVNYCPEEWEVARLSGFDICIRPRANLTRSEQHSVYGIVATGTHAELGRLYSHAKDVFGEIYLPHAVLVTTSVGTWRPALCYISSEMTPREASNDYIERIIGPAIEYGFPSWYVKRLESFRSQAAC
jgi:hypothetical protein